MKTNIYLVTGTKKYLCLSKKQSEVYACKTPEEAISKFSKEYPDFSDEIDVCLKFLNVFIK